MKCKNCGWLFACDDCSKEYSKIDNELDKKLKSKSEDVLMILSEYFKNYKR